MRIKHISARPGEYVVVHRHGGERRNSSGNSGNGMGCLIVITILAIIFFWREILTIAICCAIGYGAIYCIGKFHREVWHGIMASVTSLIIFLKKIWCAVSKEKNSNQQIDSHLNRNICSQLGDGEIYSSESCDYGKIIQKK